MYMYPEYVLWNKTNNFVWEDEIKQMGLMPDWVSWHKRSVWNEDSL